MYKTLTLAAGLALAAVAVISLEPDDEPRRTQVLSTVETVPTVEPASPSPSSAPSTAPAPRKMRKAQAAPKPTEYHPEEGKTQDEICILTGSWGGEMKYQDDADCNNKADICWDLPIRPYKGSTPPPMYAGYDPEHCVIWQGKVMHPPYAGDDPNRNDPEGVPSPSPSP